MNRQSKTLLWVCILLPFSIGSARAEPGDKIAPGDIVPPYQLETMSGPNVDSTNRQAKTTVLIYVVANQRGSERAIADASKAIKDINNQSIELLVVTANTDQSAFFTEFWEEKGIEGTLAFDPNRKLYADLGLIAFPTTLVMDHEGRLVHSLSTHSPNYPHVLDGYIRHAMGSLNDAGLAKHLKARSLPTSSPKSNASRHRAVAKLMRSKGLDESAEKELMQALEFDPESLDARLDLAELYLHQKRYPEASDYIDQVQQSNPEHRHAMLLKGILLFHQGSNEQSQQWLTKALNLNPNPARTHFYLGRVYEAQGDKDQALNHYRQALGQLLDETIE